MARRKRLDSVYVNTIDEISPKCKELKNKYGDSSCSLEICETRLGGIKIFIIEVWG